MMMEILSEAASSIGIVVAIVFALSEMKTSRKTYTKKENIRQYKRLRRA